MNRHLSLLGLLFVAVQAHAAPIPMRDFFRNPEKGFFRLSPDGKMLSFMQSYQHRMNVFVQPVAGGEPKRITAETERDIQDYFWKGNEHIVYIKDFKGDENFHLVSIRRDGTDLTDLTPFPKVR